MSAAKNLYHSELARRSSVSLTVKSDVLPSNFRDKPDYVVVFDHEEGMERRYQCENVDCGLELAECKGERVLISAVGRDSDARIIFKSHPADGVYAPQPRSHDRRDGEDDRRPARREAAPRGRREEAPARRETRREEAPRGRRREEPEDDYEPEPERKLTREEILEAERVKEEKTYKQASKYACQSSVLLENCLIRAVRMAKRVEQSENITFTPDSIERMAVTLFIETKGRTSIGDLPLVMPTPKQPKQKPEPGETYVDRSPEVDQTRKPVEKPQKPEPDVYDIPEDDIPM